MTIKVKECSFCKNRKKIDDKEMYKKFGLKNMPLESIDRFDTFLSLTNNLNNRYELYRCKKCGTFWEYRPFYEETMWGGEPGEWVKVTKEYVKEHYPDVKVD